MCECFKRDYQLREEIGCGRFGVVFRCCTATAKGFFAVNSINKRRLLDSTDRECLEKEPKILHILSPHPNILQICNPYESDSHLLIVTELCESSNLYDRIALNVFEESEAAALIIPLVEAIAHCYRHGIVHMDIKPENILFDSRNSLKLIDFGSSKWFDAENISMRGVVGTPYCVSGGVEREGVQ